jgi:hypothetical protein
MSLAADPDVDTATVYAMRLPSPRTKSGKVGSSSTDIPTTESPWSFLALKIAVRCGKTCRQGPHHLAQSSTTVTCDCVGTVHGSPLRNLRSSARGSVQYTFEVLRMQREVTDINRCPANVRSRENITLQRKRKSGNGEGEMGHVAET